MIKILLSKNTKELKDYFNVTNGDRKYWLPETEKHPSEVIKWVREVQLTDGCYSDRIIVATHSQTMVNFIGDLVEDGELSQSSVIIEIVEGKKIKQSWFDEEGDLVRWPIGFFSGRELNY